MSREVLDGTSAAQVPVDERRNGSIVRIQAHARWILLDAAKLTSRLRGIQMGIVGNRTYRYRLGLRKVRQHLACDLILRFLCQVEIVRIWVQIVQLLIYDLVICERFCLDVLVELGPILIGRNLECRSTKLELTHGKSMGSLLGLSCALPLHLSLPLLIDPLLLFQVLLAKVGFSRLIVSDFEHGYELEHVGKLQVCLRCRQSILHLVELLRFNLAHALCHVFDDLYRCLDACSLFKILASHRSFLLSEQHVHPSQDHSIILELVFEGARSGSPVYLLA